MPSPSDTGKPVIWLGVHPGDFDQETIDAVVRNLSAHANVGTGTVRQFSEDPIPVTLILDLLLSTLLNIGASALYDAIRPARREADRFTLRLVLRSKDAAGNSRAITAGIDVGDPDAFARGVNSVETLLDRTGHLFAYNDDRDKWDDLS